MKKLVIHAGYPKAASTTLQNGLFLPLHKDDRINFLGRAWESGYYGLASGKRQYKSWMRSIMDAAGARSHEPGAFSADLVGGRVNVYSEGLFMNNEADAHEFVMPDRIRAAFSKAADQIEILLVIRTQRMLIPSFYVQTYAKIREPFADYVARNERQCWAGKAKVFDFHNTASAYARTFGKGAVKICLFEDLVHDIGRFSARIADLIEVEPEAVAACLERKHLNKTTRRGAQAVVEKPGAFSLRRLTHRALRLAGVEPGDRLAATVPVPTQEETEPIFARFRDSNAKLAAEFSLDHSSMQRYGYF